MANLLSKSTLLQPNPVAEVYVVWNNKDYRMTLGTLISLVSKATIGLDHVNNTSDSEKPLSEAAISALELKADKNAVPTKQAFDALADSLENYASLDELNTAIQNIVDSLNNYTTDSELSSAITAALDPVVESLTQFSLDLQNHTDRLQAIELKTASVVNTTELNQAISSALTIADQAAAARDGEVVDYVDGQLSTLLETLQLVQQTLASLTQAYGVHKHAATEIEGLQTYVQTLIDGTIIISPNEW